MIRAQTWRARRRRGLFRARIAGDPDWAPDREARRRRPKSAKRPGRQGKPWR